MARLYSIMTFEDFEPNNLVALDTTGVHCQLVLNILFIMYSIFFYFFKKSGILAVQSFKLSLFYSKTETNTSIATNKIHHVVVTKYSMLLECLIQRRLQRLTFLPIETT